MALFTALTIVNHQFESAISERLPLFANASRRR